MHKVRALNAPAIAVPAQQLPILALRLKAIVTFSIDAASLAKLGSNLNKGMNIVHL